MATYKLIQDIEAEDKLVGPLTLKQFIYAGVTALCLYLSFIVLTKHVAFLLVVFLPPAFVFGFFAFPWKGDQPTEIWALAKVRFLFKPRRRIWDQSGVKELVTITAPKKVEENYTDGLSQTEVKSRLRALADTIDSRGWAVKNVAVNLYSQPQSVLSSASDRLIDPSTMPQQVPNVDITESDDIMDANSNPVAHHFDDLITASAAQHRAQIKQSLKQPSTDNTVPPNPPNDYWFMNQAPLSAQDSNVPLNSQVVSPGSTDSLTTAAPTADEEAMAERFKEEQNRPIIANSHLRMMDPLTGKVQNPIKRATTKTNNTETANASVTQTPDPAILQLANNNDLNVDTIARQANKKPDDQSDSTEVNIPLR